MLQWIITNPVFSALLVMATLSLILGAILGFAAVKYKVEGDPLVAQVDALLPQTQCGQCGHPGCRPYAEAIVAGEAINHCPPGGQATINNLADLLGVAAPSLDAEHGVQQEVKMVAFIREEDCIGCTKCIQACPVDAIVGAQKKMHTVIASECTGCDLCIEPCPVDCIDLLPIEQGIQQWVWDKPQAYIIASDREPRQGAAA
jgi:electron transport complex protein RnfB